MWQIIMCACVRYRSIVPVPPPITSCCHFGSRRIPDAPLIGRGAGISDAGLSDLCGQRQGGVVWFSSTGHGYDPFMLARTTPPSLARVSDRVPLIDRLVPFAGIATDSLAGEEGMLRFVNVPLQPLQPPPPPYPL